MLFIGSTRLWRARLGRFALGAAVLSASSVAAAEVARKGAWPANDPAVSFELDGIPRNEALKRLAKEAGWSLMLNMPMGAMVDIRVQGQRAGKVLDLLLSDGHYVATRDGNLISIVLAEKASVPAPPVPPAPPAPPALPEPPEPPEVAEPPEPPEPLEVAEPSEPPEAAESPELPDALESDDDSSSKHGGEHHERRNREERGRDRVVTGGSLRIEKHEVVHDVSVFGGSLDVLGTVTGDISVMGGATHIRDTARVRGDVSTVGGPLAVDDGARIGGDVDVVGGPLRRGVGAIIEGEVNSEGEQHGAHGDGARPSGSEVSELARDVGGAVTRTALLFVWGAVLLALWPRRLELLKIDIAARPMKSFALGVVGVLGALALVVALCVTLIGIPFAVIGLLLGMVAAVGACCAVLETAGAAVLNHRTKNPYVHLAAGCIALLVIGAIPYVGNTLYGVVFLTGVGALVSTRLAGLIRPKPMADSMSSGPYRTSP